MHHHLESPADPDAVARPEQPVNKTDLAAAAAASRPRCPSTSIWSTWV